MDCHCIRWGRRFRLPRAGGFACRFPHVAPLAFAAGEAGDVWTPGQAFLGPAQAGRRNRLPHRTPRPEWNVQTSGHGSNRAL